MGISGSYPMQLTLKPMGRSTAAHSSEITPNAGPGILRQETANEVRKVGGRAHGVGKDNPLGPARQ